MPQQPAGRAFGLESGGGPADTGANPVAASPNGVSPLMMAARENKTEVVTVLLEYGADLAQKNDKGETAYDWAVREEHKSVIDQLKKAAAAGSR